MYASDDSWEEVLLTDSNFCLKYAKRRRRWMRQLWESRTDGAYIKLCDILREFPNKLREYYRMNIKFGYIMDSVKNDLQGCSNFRKCIEAEMKLTVAHRFVLVILVRIKKNYITNY